jgi:hypothetical protein
LKAQTGTAETVAASIPTVMIECFIPTRLLTQVKFTTKQVRDKANVPNKGGMDPCISTFVLGNTIESIQKPLCFNGTTIHCVDCRLESLNLLCSRRLILCVFILSPARSLIMILVIWIFCQSLKNQCLLITSVDSVNELHQPSKHVLALLCTANLGWGVFPVAHDILLICIQISGYTLGILL